MVFVYPCIISENVNRQIVPAASKSMELFFLYQLQSAFNDGIISCKQVYDHGKEVPGSIQFESITNKVSDNEILLEKSFDALENIKMVINENKVYYKNNYNNPRVSRNNNIKEIITESQNVEEKLHIYRIELDNLIQESTNTDFKKSAIKVLESINKDIKTEHKFRNLLEAHNQGGAHGASPTRTSGNSNNKEDEKENKAKRESYKKSDDYKIDLTPTSIPLEVDVSVTDGSKVKTVKKMITVGVKVVPIKIKNFNQVNDALLDDYFSRFSEGLFKSIYRSAARSIMNSFRRILDKIGLSKFLPDPADAYYEKKGDIVKKMITMAPSNYVNASAFRSNLNSAPQNYKFTSSVVMFNKDDIDEDESIFENRSAMNRLFKLGWTSFAVLDPVKEVMLFISNLDGGFLHILPYSYMFNTLNANDIYKNESALRNGTRPFSIRKGNFATFARNL